MIYIGNRSEGKQDGIILTKTLLSNVSCFFVSSAYYAEKWLISRACHFFLHAITTYDMLADITEPKKMLHNYLV